MGAHFLAVERLHKNMTSTSPFCQSGNIGFLGGPESGVCIYDTLNVYSVCPWLWANDMKYDCHILYSTSTCKHFLPSSAPGQ